jgi:hypothetical protein
VASQNFVTRPGSQFVQSGTGAVERTVTSKLQDIVHVTDFASNLSSGSDWTQAIQRALDELESRGGGVCQLPEGTLYISLANSVNVNTCLQVPANVIFQGAGIDATIIQRLPSERGVDGVLITNKYWDTNGGYTAAGNIIFQDFTITDGAPSPQRSSGDLIGLGHADRVIVQRVKAGNHDQHFVDICGSKRVKVLDCFCFNEHAGGYNASSTLQIDGVASGAIRGIYVDSTVSTDVEIAGNHIINKTSDITMHVGHKAMVFSNINIHNNYFEGGYASNQNVIASDTNCSFSNVQISNNTIVCSNANARCVNFFISGNGGETIENFTISNNTLSGSSRVGIYVGTNSSYTGSSFPSFNNISVINNNIEINSSGVSGYSYGVQLVGTCNSIVSGNIVKVVQTTDSGSTSGIILGRSDGLHCVGNKVSKSVSYLSTGKVSDGIAVLTVMPSGTTKSSISVSDNFISLSGIKYAINTTGVSGYVYGHDYILASCNRSDNNYSWYNPSDALDTGGLIYENMAISAGDNFRSPVDLGVTSGIYVLPVSSGKFYSGLPLAGRKKSPGSSNILSPAKIELQYSPNSSGGFNSDVEYPLFGYLSPTLCAGIQVADIDQPNGKFSLLTGISGTSVVINNATFQPVIRTGGFIRAFSSL